jgi:glucose/arabinose dehydrogenase
MVCYTKIMLKTLIVIVALSFITVILFFHATRSTELQKTKPTEQQQPTHKTSTSTFQPSAVVFATIATHLDTPWALSFLPNGDLLITERAGNVLLLSRNSKTNPTLLLQLDDVKEIGEGGLMGIAIHPNFSIKPYVFLYYTHSQDGDKLINRLVRFKYIEGRLTEKTVLIDKIPGASNHNGGRIKFGPDMYLYITTGDAQEPYLAQDKDSLAGKILRVTDEGKPAPGNPFNNYIYSYGHRNPQGLAWDKENRLWATEHGRSNPSGFDEINLIEIGKNYGWPEIQGNEKKSAMETPILNSGPTSTWAPAGAVFFKNSLFFAGLRGQTLYEAEIKNNQVVKLKEHFKEQFGRLREVVLGPDNMLYITTSNKDGRGYPKADDDKVIRINPEKLE